DVNSTGSTVALASRKGLLLRDLGDQHPEVVFWHPSFRDVVVVKWSQHDRNKDRLAMACDNNLVIWNRSDLKRPLEAVLKSHTRPITHASWSPLEASKIATSSHDNSINLWDIRSQKPVQRFTAPYGAIQVEWNRVNTFQLASAHEKEVRIWDTRKGGHASSGSLGVFTAHVQRITGLDWSHTSENELLTGSQDKTVRVWAIKAQSDSDRTGRGAAGEGPLTGVPKASCPMEHPLYKVLFAPFGEGVVTTSRGVGEQKDAPQTLRLWSIVARPDYPGEDQTFQLVHPFRGPKARIMEACWRVTEEHHFQLVSLDKQQHLRLHEIDPSHLLTCGYDPDMQHSDLWPHIPPEQNVMSSFTNKLNLTMTRKELFPGGTSPDNRSVPTLNTNHVPYILGELWKLDKSVKSDRKLKDVADFHVMYDKRMVVVTLLGRRQRGTLAEEGHEHGVVYGPERQGVSKVSEGEREGGDACSGTARLHVVVTVPERYPAVDHPPVFQLSSGKNPADRSGAGTLEDEGIDPLDSDEILFRLNSQVDMMARDLLSEGKYCLEDCLLALKDSLDMLLRGDNQGMHSGGVSEPPKVSDSHSSQRHLEKLQFPFESEGAQNRTMSADRWDATGASLNAHPSSTSDAPAQSSDMAGIPCPSLFGATFSPSGVLVVFSSSLDKIEVRAGGLSSPVGGGDHQHLHPTVTRFPRTYEELSRCLQFAKFSTRPGHPPHSLGYPFEGNGSGIWPGMRPTAGAGVAGARLGQPLGSQQGHSRDDDGESSCYSTEEEESAEGQDPYTMEEAARLPINHPNHSLGEPGLECSYSRDKYPHFTYQMDGDTLRVKDTARGAATVAPWAPRANHVVLLDLSPHLPGSVQLSLSYSLGHCSPCEASSVPATPASAALSSPLAPSMSPLTQSMPWNLEALPPAMDMMWWPGGSNSSGGMPPPSPFPASSLVMGRVSRRNSVASMAGLRTWVGNAQQPPSLHRTSSAGGAGGVAGMDGVTMVKRLGRSPEVK
ncbi:unnamed protein product, partial [Discosporangium mesarthrocarpum]